MMRYWLNVHHPVEMGRNRDEWNQVYLSEIHRNTALRRINRGDIAVIYEMDRDEGKRTAEGIPLQGGRKGITAIVRLTNLEDDDHVFDGKRYKWRFNAEPVWTGLIPLHRIDREWQVQRGGKHFIPRTNGGLRELSIGEWQVIARLAGLRTALLPDE